MVNTMQQVGGSIGTALLSSIFAERGHQLRDGHARRRRQLLGAAAVHGYTVAFWVARACSPSATPWSALVMRSVRVAHPAGQPAAAHA